MLWGQSVLLGTVSSMGETIGTMGDTISSVDKIPKVFVIFVHTLNIIHSTDGTPHA